MAAAESRRGDESDATKRIYPGGAFDPLGFAKVRGPPLLLLSHSPLC